MIDFGDIKVSHQMEKPNTYEFGKAGNRFKLHFNDAKDLKDQMEELRKLGLIEEFD